MGFRLSKIYTRTGDTGETGLGDGRRVPKDHPRVEAIGEVDMLNSQLGLLLAGLQEWNRSAQPNAAQPGTAQPSAAATSSLAEISAALAPCQHRLFDLGGELAMPAYTALDAAQVQGLEALIDAWNEELGPLENFILPGGSSLIAQAHICRAAARGAERRCQQLNAVEPISAYALAYINRLSDLLFVAARLIAKRQGIAEILWVAAPKPTTAQ